MIALTKYILDPRIYIVNLLDSEKLESMQKYERNRHEWLCHKAIVNLFIFEIQNIWFYNTWKKKHYSCHILLYYVNHFNNNDK